MKTERVWYIRTDGEDWKIGRAPRLDSWPDEQAVQFLKKHCDNLGEQLVGVCRADDKRIAVQTLYMGFLLGGVQNEE